ncbi:MAG: hypothetical protein PVI30_16850 [Myxococcales bacterium]|jgi:hypothetical protein
MSRLDVLRSLLRSTAVNARRGLENLPVAEALRRFVEEATLGRATLSDAELTKALGRVSGVSAVTVSADGASLRIDAGFDDGQHVQLRVRPTGVMFAPGGAKEVAFAVEPAGAVERGRTRDLVGALGGAIARQLWAPVLANAPRTGGGAMVSGSGGQLHLDLRSVPEVRWALGKRLHAATIETLKLHRIEVGPGGLLLGVTLTGLEHLRR